ncbi:hypothetical protein QVD17_32831 [Tagetes erecta]|uniref:C2H2-type domain-containing protein n=1 Tax=Tagetes erecta TaxID=13708 RepID=A0AAD8JVX5_TARER|nr:hypothetical protein QVD17_32831 [Tagetes erecta]
MVNNSGSGSETGSNPTPPPQPPPPPPPPPSSSTKRPTTPAKPKQRSSVCPVCKRNLYHERALNGHIRWHTVEEREAAGISIARALASAVVVEEPEAVKRAKVPDLNRSPPPEDGEA